MTLLLSVLIYLNFQFLNWPIISVILVGGWLFFASKITGKLIEKLFDLNKKYLKLLNYFLVIFIFGLILNIFTAWFVFSNLTILLALIITPLLLVGLNKILAKEKVKKISLTNKPIFKKNKFLSEAVVILAIIGYIIFFTSGTGKYIQSPWEVLNWSFVIIALLLFLIMYYLTLSKEKTKKIIWIIILVSLVLHSYTLVYQTGFGGDKWRHIGSEYRLLEEIEYQPTLLADDLWQQKIAGVNVPRALVDGPKLSYGFSWSVSAFTSKVTGVDVYNLDKYLGIILWSLFLPLIVILGASQIISNKQFVLMAGALTCMFYVFQYYGSQTLPVGYGLIYFAFLVASWLSLIRKFSKKKLMVIIILTLLAYFNYSLAFIFAIGLIGLYLVNIAKSNWVKGAGIAVLSGLVLVTDWLGGFNSFGSSGSLVQIFTGFIRQSNILYFETGRWIPLVKNINFYHWHWSFRISEIIGLIFVIILVSIICKALRNKKNQPIKFMAGGLIILSIGYLLSWNLLTGLHILGRRFDIFMVLFALFVFAWGIFQYLPKTKKYALLLVVILTLVSLLTYVSGPVLNATVTQNEVKATKYVWNQMKDAPSDYCVVANTWPLLALESWSAKEVVAGNFPSDYNHQADERVAIFDDINKYGEERFLDAAQDATGKVDCYLILNTKKASEPAIENLNLLIGEPEKTFGDNVVWSFD